MSNDHWMPDTDPDKDLLDRQDKMYDDGPQINYDELVQLVTNSKTKKCIYCKCLFLAYSEGEEVCRNELCQDILDEYYLTMVYEPKS